jgi:hypothetical protein
LRLRVVEFAQGCGEQIIERFAWHPVVLAQKSRSNVLWGERFPWGTSTTGTPAVVSGRGPDHLE